MKQKSVSGPKFGTSGLRGLVTDLTPELVGRYIRAFVRSCEIGAGIHIGHDLRPSSPQLAETVAAAAGCAVVMCGPVPTPALALAAMSQGFGAVMITGSHIPADRNGLKFYTPSGEITKADEAAILAALDDDEVPAPGLARKGTDEGANYAARYRSAFGQSLSGQRIGFYAQSAVGRDLMVDLLTDLGARVTELGRADHFVPVDTEAVPHDVRNQLKAWADSGKFDAIVSTDADGDRPMVADRAGRIIPGDILGQITGAFLGAQVAVTPVSSNSGAEVVFGRVLRTKIGSPYVIAEMEKVGGRVVGYEANGGFLLGFDAQGPAGRLPKLMTRDAVLPIVAVLTAVKGDLRSGQPERFTASDRLQNVGTSVSQALVMRWQDNASERAAFLAHFGLSEQGVDLTDGLRITATTGEIVHLRPSGNAPELRFYTEASDQLRADQLLHEGLGQLAAMLT